MREKIVRELEDLDFAVLPPKGIISLETPGFGDAISDCLSRCKAAVHFAGASAGIVREGETQPLVALQVSRALEHDLPRIVWIEPGVAPCVGAGPPRYQGPFGYGDT